MFKIGDIVRPKKGFSGHNYCFKIIESEINPFDYNLYKLQRIEQSLDPTEGPLNLQLKTIRNVETTFWKEKELELTSTAKLRYNVSNLDDINDIAETNSEFLNQYAKKLRKECEVKINKMNEEENEMQILDLYKERKSKVLEKKLLEAKEAVRKEDEIQSIIIEMTNQINTILENQDSDTRYESHPNLYTSETEKKLDELNQKYYEEIETLRSTLEEIRALFELTDDYNERMKILKKYGILNKDGKLNV